jgi:hypothetical protein
MRVQRLLIVGIASSAGDFKKVKMVFEAWKFGCIFVSQMK